jgi:hypothetical protein
MTPKFRARKKAPKCVQASSRCIAAAEISLGNTAGQLANLLACRPAVRLTCWPSGWPTFQHAYKQVCLQTRNAESLFSCLHVIHPACKSDDMSACNKDVNPTCQAALLKTRRVAEMIARFGDGCCAGDHAADRGGVGQVAIQRVTYVARSHNSIFSFFPDSSFIHFLLIF